MSWSITIYSGCVNESPNTGKNPEKVASKFVNVYTKIQV